MPNSSEVRRLSAKWQQGTGWPKRLDWIEIKGLRGWGGQRFELRYPIMAVVGENGAGKSTVLQCAAAVYASDPPVDSSHERYASDFFPETAWDKLTDVEVAYALREGSTSFSSNLRKPTTRWRGNQERKPRHVEYIDLSRIQPVHARAGYKQLALSNVKEISAQAFDDGRLRRYSDIMGRKYELAKMATTDADARREVPVVGQQGATYSGFHQGAGETTIAELIKADLPKYSLVLIDEIESSLHPRVQRRLMRDLADLCRERELQVILTTHSPYVIEELPLEARAYILTSPGMGREIVYGVTPEFAMSKMDDEPYYECDIYVEDDGASRMLVEILVQHGSDLVNRCQIIPYGAAGVGQSLGQMVAGNRFPRPSCVFLDGDKAAVVGCLLLPGQDAPERVVFEGLHSNNWGGLSGRVGRGFSDGADSCTNAMSLADHHEWVRTAATRLMLSGETLWQAMCAEWVAGCLSTDEAKPLVQSIRDTLNKTGTPAIEVVKPATVEVPAPIAAPAVTAAVGSPKPLVSSSVQPPLFGQ